MDLNFQPLFSSSRRQLIVQFRVSQADLILQAESVLLPNSAGGSKSHVGLRDHGFYCGRWTLAHSIQQGS